MESIDLGSSFEGPFHPCPQPPPHHLAPTQAPPSSALTRKAHEPPVAVRSAVLEAAEDPKRSQWWRVLRRSLSLSHFIRHFVLMVAHMSMLVNVEFAWLHLYYFAEFNCR